MIGAGTLATTVADSEDRAKLAIADIRDYDQLAVQLAEAGENTPAAQVIGHPKLSPTDVQFLLQPAKTEADKAKVVELLNRVLLNGSLYDEQAFLGVAISDVAKSKLAANQLRMKPVDRRRMNRRCWRTPTRN